MSEMDQFIAGVYSTGMSEEEKVAAEQTVEVAEMEKAAAMEHFAGAMEERGLDPEQYSDEEIASAFNQFVEGFSKEAAEVATPEDGEELIKQAWAEADAYGRHLAQQEFINLVKESAKEEKAPGKVRRAGRWVKETGTKGAKGAGKGVSATMKFIGKHPKKTLIPAAALQAAGMAGAGVAGAKYLKEKKGSDESAEQTKVASPTPFLDDAIEKCAMAYGITSGMITPDGDPNINEEGYIYEPSWTEEYGMEEPKTALDQQVHIAALRYLEEAGYPVNWGEEA